MLKRRGLRVGEAPDAVLRAASCLHDGIDGLAAVLVEPVQPGEARAQDGGLLVVDEALQHPGRREHLPYWEGCMYVRMSDERLGKRWRRGAAERDRRSSSG